MYILLVVLSVVVMAFGLFNLTDATFGVGLIAIAGVLGVLGRIVQANQHQGELLSAMEDEDVNPFVQAVEDVKAGNEESTPPSSSD